MSLRDGHQMLDRKATSVQAILNPAHAGTKQLCAHWWIRVKIRGKTVLGQRPPKIIRLDVHHGIAVLIPVNGARLLAVQSADHGDIPALGIDRRIEKTFKSRQERRLHE
jgi:hypothetical protein